MSELDDKPAEPASKGKTRAELERPLFLVCAVLGLGPFALPLIWRHPGMKWYWKLYITLSVIALTWGCIVLTKVMIEHLREQWEIIQELSE